VIKVFDDTKNVCECCDNNSVILIDFMEDAKPKNLGTRLYLCEDCKRDLVDILLPF
jgi:hypothetical protein